MKNTIISTKKSFWIGYKTNDLIWTVGITMAIIISPAILAHTPANQIITGTIVNSLLFLAAFRMPLANAIMIASLPSLIALTRGLLPTPMAMMIPFIITSNIALITTFSFFKKTPLKGVLVASFLKFGILYSVTLIFAQKLNAQFITMLSWPQLITALLGGFIFLSLLKIFSKD